LRTRSFLFLAAAVTASVGLGGPAAAASPRHIAFRLVDAGGSGSSRSVAAVPNQFFGGYASTTGAPSMNVTSTFVVPRIKRCGHTNRGIAAVVGGDHTIGGTTSAGLFVGCVNGKARYFPVLDLDGNVKRYRSAAVRAGDRVVLSAKENSVQAAVSLVDMTRSSTTKRLAAGTGSFKDFAVGDEGWTSSSMTWGVPDFGTLRFSKSKLNGHPLGSVALTRYDKTDTVGTVQIKTSPLASDKETFKTVFVHS
jgi:hypothetical protein